jgi:rubrerythrin
MSVSFSTGELMNIAIGIEQRGVAFYDVMVKSTDNAATRHIFQHLADMEREHIQIFQNMLATSDTDKKLTEAPADYLKVLLDNAVFTDEMIASEITTQADSDLKALELGIMAEEDSLLFYYQRKEFISQRNQRTVNRIITEEKAHLGLLSELKNKLAAL